MFFISLGLAKLLDSVFCQVSLSFFQTQVASCCSGGQHNILSSWYFSQLNFSSHRLLHFLTATLSFHSVFGCRRTLSFSSASDGPALSTVEEISIWLDEGVMPLIFSIIAVSLLFLLTEWSLLLSIVATPFSIAVTVEKREQRNNADLSLWYVSKSLLRISWKSTAYTSNHSRHWNIMGS